MAKWLGSDSGRSGLAPSLTDDLHMIHAQVNRNIDNNEPL